jgi:hypothetical protein
MVTWLHCSKPTYQVEIEHHSREHMVKQSSLPHDGQIKELFKGMPPVTHFPQLGPTS